MNSEFESNQDDPYVTIKDSDDDEEEEPTPAEKNFEAIKADKDADHATGGPWRSFPKP